MQAPAPQPSAIPFDNSYGRLPERFYTRQAPTPVPAPSLIRVNRGLATELGLEPEALVTPEAVAWLAGNGVPGGADPLAQAYAGHQFGGWNPGLGDGRALLLGEVLDRNGQRRDIQLKGSGPTPYSRMGDGRAPLGPVLREYIVSEGMAALGVPTTRALAAVATGEPVVRERVEPGAVLTRVAASHIRVGTFQYFYAREDVDALRLLADHAIGRHDPDLADAGDDRFAGFLDRVIARQAGLIAQWMGLGFVHGVMNTDNMTVSGETIDYGPCAFIEAFHPDTVFSSIDQQARYSYRNQPGIGQWNLAQLAQAMLPLFPGDEAAQIAKAQAAIDAYPALFQQAWLQVIRAKIGLPDAAPDDATRAEADATLINALLTAMAQNQADFTLTFQGLADGTARENFVDPTAFDHWAEDWAKAGGTAEGLAAVNPLYIPRNHLVAQAIAAAETDDFEPFNRMVDVLATPFAAQEGADAFALPATSDQAVRQTFCGT